jgi:serine/threonine protein kinase/Tol biopolymer transport system component
MALAAGMRLGPYEIVSALGAGGMGEVYKARDTRLDRIVAVKILRETLAADSQFRDRFDREARTISQLDHPNICALYDVGEQNGTAYLVMQYLEGETLADRLKKGPLPIDQALRIAIEIAKALDKAHRAGVIHRDLKPGNIMLNKLGAKLLDFGLAKTRVSPMAGAGMSMLPTVTNLTSNGAIIGTFQYMAPEQLEGREADARTDIFAFGAVVYEVLTGKKAFEGQSQASLISAIMSADPPPMSISRPLTPQSLDHVVRRCLAKNPDDRWQTASDLMRELEWLADSPPPLAGSPPASARGNARERLMWLSATGLLLLTALGLAVYSRRTSEHATLVRMSVPAPQGVTAVGLNFKISPDGSLVFPARSADGTQRLYVRPLDTLDARALAGTEEAVYPFWSADGHAIAFFVDRQLKKIDVAGGSVITLCDAPEAGGGSWNQDGVIIFSSAGRLLRVSAAGGTPALLTGVNGGRERARLVHPVFLPGGRQFLYNDAGILGASDEAAIYAASLDSNDRKRLFPAASNLSYAEGYLFFMRGTTLTAQPFDAARLSLNGDAFPIVEDLLTLRDGFMPRGAFAVTEKVLAYRTGRQGRGVDSQLVWFDRAGKQIDVLGDRAEYADLELSADGRHAAISVLDPARGSRDIWIFDVPRGLRTRFTSDAADDLAPVWSPDSSRLVFGSRRKGPLDLYQKVLSSKAGSEDEVLLTDSLDKTPTSWSPDGRFLLYEAVSDGTGADLWILPLGSRKPFPFLQTRFNEGSGRFSPDGRWIAYASNESGRFEVYVVPFPGPGAKSQVSFTGGNWPRWRRDGKELFYSAPGNRLMGAAVNGSGSAFEVTAARSLFQAPATVAGGYALSTDGERLLINTLVEDRTPVPITLVLNWTAALKK